MSSTENSKVDLSDWLRGLLHGSLGGFTGFFAGVLIQAIFSITANPPTFATDLPFIGTLGGFTFGFASGVARDL